MSRRVDPHKHSQQRLEPDSGAPWWDDRELGPVVVYKGRSEGSIHGPRCAACLPRNVAGQAIPLGRGILLGLCTAHQDPAFILSRNGRDFLASIAAAATAYGASSTRFREALSAFIARCRARKTPTRRHQPGSYAWPAQRLAAEIVWAAGGTYHDGEAVVIASLTTTAGIVKAPSRSTVRRWWRDARWHIRAPSPPLRHPPVAIPIRPTRPAPVWIDAPPPPPVPARFRDTFTAACGIVAAYTNRACLPASLPGMH
jgi:hypothetical protein